ncbi:hypothetical protein TNCV_4856301 [Trichonephila clavipes]|nr:hypothetical protein TNCV_4856301 [Trichonephila clavipes]
MTSHDCLDYNLRKRIVGWHESGQVSIGEGRPTLRHGAMTSAQDHYLALNAIDIGKQWFIILFVILLPCLVEEFSNKQSTVV